MILERTRYWIRQGYERASRAFQRHRAEKPIGKRGEEMAERFLIKAGYKILACGYYDHQGEIDIIAVDGRTVVFVEVKTRSSDLAGMPASAVDETKQSKIIGTAKTYLKQHRLENQSVRFDVIAILYDAEGMPQLEHIIAAFQETAI